MNIELFLLQLSIIISSSGIIFTGLIKKKYGARINILFMMFVFLFIGIVHNITIYYSIQTDIKNEIALLLYKIAIVARISSLIFLFIVHRLILRRYKLDFIVTFFVITFAFIIIGMLFIDDSVLIIEQGNIYIFKIQNIYLAILFFLFDLFIVGLMIIVELKYFSKITNKKLGFIHCSLIFLICTVTIFNTVYFLTQILIFSYLHLILYLIGACLVIFTVIKTPQMYISLTNKIYDFIILHRSGIMLYSYNFKTGQEMDQSLLKGSILIGINHILVNFSNKKDQLNIIKMQNRDLIFEFDNDLGYALLIIVDRNTKILKNAVFKFMMDFNQINKDKLKSLNGLIDISEFKDIEDIIEKNFYPFI